MEKEGIVLEGVSKKFSSNLVLDNISYSFSKSGITGILGLSGCGKTTMLKLLIGYWKTSKGKIFYDGIDVRKEQNLVHQYFGFATQNGSLYPKLTVEENLIYFGRLYNLRGRDLKERIPEILNYFELEDVKDRVAENLSEGMYRRLDIACAMIHNPHVLILDEPTSNIDPVLRKKVLAFVRKISDDGTKVLLTSHIIEEIENVCDDIVILHKGKVLASGTIKELKDNYTKEEIIKFKLKSGNYEKVKPYLNNLQNVRIYDKNEHLYIYTQDTEHVLEFLMDIIKREQEVLEDIELKKPSVEEVFEALTRWI